MTDQSVNLYIPETNTIPTRVFGMNKALKLAKHLRKYLLLYVFIVIIIAVPVGYMFKGYMKTHADLIKTLILVMAVTTLYPSMIQLKLEKLGGESKSKVKELILGLTIIFIVVPLTAMLLAGYIENKLIGIGFVAANTVPASSASIAYALLAEGNIELATLLSILSIFIALVAAPAYISLYASTVSVSIPLSILAESITIALITPLVLGQLTRYYLVKRRARKILRDKNHHGYGCKQLPEHVKNVEELAEYLENACECIQGRISEALKPYLSLVTMIAMLILIFLLISFKAGILVSKPWIAAGIILGELAIYAIVIALLVIGSKLLRIRYEDHMGIAFIALTKNESVAAAISLLAIGPVAALPAALIPAIQPIIAIIYVSLADQLRKLLP